MAGQKRVEDARERAYARPSTSFEAAKDVDARDKRGHDGWDRNESILGSPAHAAYPHAVRRAHSIVRINEKQWNAPTSGLLPLFGSMKNNGMRRPAVVLPLFGSMKNNGMSRPVVVLPLFGSMKNNGVRRPVVVLPLFGSMKNNGMRRPWLSCHGRGARGEGTFTSDFVPPFPAHLHEGVVGACPPIGDHAVALGVDIGGGVAEVHP
jgi:hypothetical protein